MDRSRSRSKPSRAKDRTRPDFQTLLGADSDVQKAPCENTFRAITNSVLTLKVCDITGVVAIACAQHGCYTPNSIVNLYKSEQQKSVDFAILRAIETTGVDPDQEIGRAHV